MVGLSVAQCLHRLHHPRPVIILLTLSLRAHMLYSLLKFALVALVALVAVPLCFALSALIRKLPYADRVL